MFEEKCVSPTTAVLVALRPSHFFCRRVLVITACETPLGIPVITPYHVVFSTDLSFAEAERLGLFSYQFVLSRFTSSTRLVRHTRLSSEFEINLRFGGRFLEMLTMRLSLLYLVLLSHQMHRLSIKREEFQSPRQ